MVFIMSRRTLNASPFCLRFPCKCGGGDDVAVNKKEPEILAEKKSPNLAIMPQQPALVQDKLLKQLEESFRLMVNSRVILFAPISPSAYGVKKQNVALDSLDADKENDGVADAANSSGPGV